MKELREVWTRGLEDYQKRIEGFQRLNWFLG